MHAPCVAAGATADEGILRHLEGHGVPRRACLAALAAGEANHATASYLLLAAAKADLPQPARQGF